MNPYHDDEGRFTSSENAQTQTGQTRPRTSPEHSRRHQERVAAGDDPRGARPAYKRPQDMTPAEARDHLERTKPQETPQPSIAHEVIDLIRHPFTPKSHHANGAPRSARAPYEGDPPDPEPAEPPAAAARKTTRTPPLKADELKALRDASPDGTVTNEDVARRDSGLNPYRRSPGPRLLTGGRSAPTLNELHASQGVGLHQAITRQADRTGSDNRPATGWPGVQRQPNPHTRRPTEAARTKAAAAPSKKRPR